MSRVVMKDSKNGRLSFEVESLQGRQIRADLARTVVNSGWNLNELRAVGLAWKTSSCNSPAAEQDAASRGKKEATQ